MYHISTISDILPQGVNSLAQWLEHWISTPAVQVRILFQTMHHFLVTNFHIHKNYKVPKAEIYKCIYTQAIMKQDFPTFCGDSRWDIPDQKKRAYSSRAEPRWDASRY